MQIKKFDDFQKLKGNWESTDKILKVVPRPFEVKIDTVRETDNYLKSVEKKGNVGWRKDYAILFGLDEYIYKSTNIEYDYILVDGEDNVIEDEDKFDEYVKNIKKYNL
jgi:hypothetical protein